MSCGYETGEAEAFAARALIALHKRSEAVEMASKAASYHPDDAIVLDTIGVVFSRTGHHDRALPFYEDATRRAPNDPGYLYNYGTALQFLGRFEAAKSAFRNCIARDPENGKALVALATLGEDSGAIDLVASLQRVWRDRVRDDPDMALQISHALARCFEDRGDPDQAMEWVLRGKQE